MWDIKPIRTTDSSNDLSEHQIYELYGKFKALKSERDRYWFLISNAEYLQYLIYFVDINFLLYNYHKNLLFKNLYTPKIVNHMSNYYAYTKIDVSNLIKVCKDAFPEWYFKTEEYGKNLREITQRKKSDKLSEHSSCDECTSDTVSDIISETAFETCQQQVPSEPIKLKLLCKKNIFSKYSTVKDKLIDYKREHVLIRYHLLQNLDKIDSYKKLKEMSIVNKQKCYTCLQNGITHFSNVSCISCGYTNYLQCQRTFDATKVRALVTGCRHTIGHQICLKLLRNGATVVGTSRYPCLAYRNFRLESDFETFKRRLYIHQIDFRSMTMIKTIENILRDYSINTYVNNAFLTVKPCRDEILLTVQHEQKLQMLEYHDERVSLLSRNLLSIKYDNVHMLKNTFTEPTEQSTDLAQVNTQLESLQDHNKNILVRPVDGVLTNNTWNKGIENLEDLELVELNLVNNMATTYIIKEVVKYFRTMQNQNPVLIQVTSSEAFHSTDKHSLTGSHKICIDRLIKRIHMKDDNRIYTYIADPGFVTGVQNTQTKPLTAVEGATRVLYGLMNILDGVKTTTKECPRYVHYRTYSN